jgi:hypothetical protein
VETLWGNIKGQETGQPLCRRPGGTGHGGPQWHGASRILASCRFLS